MSLLVITHDLGLLRWNCDRVYVMYAGHTIEHGPTERVLMQPMHPYTQGLIAASRLARGADGHFATIGGDVPVADRQIGCLPVRRALPAGDGHLSARDARRNSGPHHAARCWAGRGMPVWQRRMPAGRRGMLELRGVTKTFHQRGQPPLHAVQDVSLTVQPGETLALVGESGSGKTTLARIALCLVEPDSGDVLLDGRSLLRARRSVLRAARLRLQPVFQDSSAAFNPRRTVRAILRQVLAQAGAAVRRSRAVHAAGTRGAAAGGGISGSLSQRTQRRAAAAPGGGAGHRAGAAGDHRRRTVVRRRRVDPRADAEPAAGPAGRLRRRLPADHPRHPAGAGLRRTASR